jgi:hypothetical protein
MDICETERYGRSIGFDLERRRIALEAEHSTIYFTLTLPSLCP